MRVSVLIRSNKVSFHRKGLLDMRKLSVHQDSLISAFIICFVESIIASHARSGISIF